MPGTRSMPGAQAPDAATRPLRIGVIGVGRIGRMHAELLARQVPGAELAMVHDATPAAAEAAGAELGVPVAVSSEALLDCDDVEAVAICSSTATHADLLVAAARAGKAAFCEKPISLDLAEVDRALAAVAEAGIAVQIGFNRRFDPAHQSVAQAVADGTIGDVQLVRISSRDPAPPPLEYVRGSATWPAARSSRSTRAARCASSRPSPRPATSTPPWSPSRTPTAA